LAAGPFNTPARGHRIALFMQPLRPVSELYCPAYEKMIRDLIGWVARIKDARIVVKLHPQQTEFFVEESFTEPTIERTDGYQSETRNVELILGSRVVVTHCSSVAWLSMHLRRPVVFIHEGHQESHPLAAFGVSQISNGSDDLLRRVEMLLFDRQYFEKVIAEQSIEVARVMRADANVAKRLVESLKHAADSQHVA